MPSKIKKKPTNSDTPQTELELQKLQNLYLEDRSNKQVSDEYFMLMRTYARSIALKVIKRKSIFLPPERVDEISTDATLLTMRQYEKEGWKVSVSFAGILIWKIYEAMFSQANDEMNSSLNLTFTEDKDSKEVMDMVGSGSCLPWTVSAYGAELPDDDPAESLIKSINVAYEEIIEVIDEAYTILPYKTFMRFLPWVVLQIRKPRTRNIQQLFDSLYLTNKEQNAFDILMLEMHKRIKHHT